MNQESSNNISNRNTRAAIVIDGSRSEMSGTLYSYHYCAGTRFFSVLDLVNTLESLLNSLNCPQPAMLTRSFEEGGRFTTKEVFQVNDIDKIVESAVAQAEPQQSATFVVNVLYRQNASWQGTVNWVNKKKTVQFRSMLELIRLMDSALNSGEQVVVDWKEE